LLASSLPFKDILPELLLALFEPLVVEAKLSVHLPLNLLECKRPPLVIILGFVPFNVLMVTGNESLNLTLSLVDGATPPGGPHGLAPFDEDGVLFR
jgi:hypothetical protein